MEPLDIVNLVSGIVSIIASIILVFVSSKLYNRANFRTGLINSETIKSFYVRLNDSYNRYFSGEKAGTTEAYVSFSSLLREMMEDVAVLRFADEKRYNSLVACLVSIDDALSANKNRPINVVQKEVESDLVKFTKLIEKYYSA